VFWEEHGKIVELELVIPTVVKGELLFLQTTSALKALAKIDENYKRIAAITSAPHNHRLSQDRMRGEIEAKIDKWLRSKKARLAEFRPATEEEERRYQLVQAAA